MHHINSEQTHMTEFLGVSYFPRRGPIMYTVRIVTVGWMVTGKAYIAASDQFQKQEGH